MPGVFSVAVGIVLLICFVKGVIRELESTKDQEAVEATGSEMKRGILLLLITVACTGIIYQATSFVLPKLIEIRLSEHLGDGLVGVGALVSVIYFLSGGMQLAGGWLADKFHLKSVYLLCWLCQVPLLVGAAFLNTTLLLPVLAVMVVANTIGSPAENSLFAKYSPPKWRSTAFGVKFVLALGVAAMAVPLVSWTYKLVGEFTWLLIILAAIAGCAVVFSSLLPAKKSDREHELADTVS
ncbi:MAG: hypothetical protein CMM58_02290 [Rhodospirillaceae bacterium]|nr:hypothetical protein [Rhodospirillaceae bacterium]